MRNKPYAIGNYEAPSILKRRVGSAEDLLLGMARKQRLDKHVGQSALRI